MTDSGAAPRKPGLWLIATPIGNLADIAPRALRVLAEVSFVACEDTRRTGLLLQRLGIDAGQLLAVHGHNEAAACQAVVDRLQAGESAAYVTDAGMPAVSDPGRRLVAAAAAAGIGVSVVPGPSAPVAALAVSGLPTDRWLMEGFMPRSGEARTARVAAIAAASHTTVLLESPHRLGATLAELCDACGDGRPAVVVRELTKLHEEVVRGTLGSLAERYAVPTRGEIVLVVGPAPPAPPTDAQIDAELHAEFAAGASARDAAAAVAQRLDVSRNRVYPQATKLKPSRTRS